MAVLLDPQETAACLAVKLSSIRDKRFRARIGLPVVKVGRCLRFAQDDVLQVVRRGREGVGVRQDAHASVAP